MINNIPPPSLESFHPATKIPPTHTVTATLGCHSSQNYTSFYSSLLQKLDHWPLLFLDAVINAAALL